MLFKVLLYKESNLRDQFYVDYDKKAFLDNLEARYKKIIENEEEQRKKE